MKTTLAARPDVKPGALIQRRCACGSTRRDGLGQCPECEGRKRLQTRLRVGAIDDPLEVEAERVADRVAAGTAASDPTPAIGNALLRAPAEDARAPETDLDRSLAASAGRGHALDPRAHAMAERGLGRRFDSVRVHTDGEADALNRSVGARAFTSGNDVYFGAGEYRPHTRAGLHLIAHELTHVVQQGGGGAPRVQRAPADGGGAAGAPAGGGLTPTMLEQIARRLYDAMSGLGTDEEAIYAALSGRSQAQVDAIEQTYNRLFDANLQADLRDELTDSELETLAIQSPTASREADRPRLVAEQLHAAMDRIGTDESRIFSALTGRTESERTAIQAAYQSLTGRALIADLRDELSGSELTEAIRLFNQGELRPEDELFLAMAGAGTDEARIERIMDSLRGDPAAITAMETAYRAKYGDVIADLRGDLSGGELESAVGAVAPTLQNAAFEDCNPGNITTLRNAMPMVDQKLTRATTVLSRGLAAMTVPERNIFSAYFDPAGSGHVDQGFIGDVLANFRSLRSEFDAGLTFECETAGGLCSVAGRYGYTYFGNIHICPYFFTMTATSQSRGILHELTHNALWAVDRHYGHEAEFSQLTPRGNVGNQIPVIGPLIRLIARDDTLYNPDSYAYFAFSV